MVGLIESAHDSRLFQLRLPGVPRGPVLHRRGCVRQFSQASRRRMMRKLASISTKAELPVFLTLTFPDSIPLHALQDFHFAKRCLDVFLKRLSRELPGASGIWRLEWQTRKSGVNLCQWVPHLHLLLWGVPSYAVAEGRDCVPILRYCWKARESSPQYWWDFECTAYSISAAVRSLAPVRDEVELWEFVSVAWYHAVGSGDPEHMRVGTRVDRVRSQRALMSYCSKYVAKVDEAADTPASGRCWGIHNRRCIPWAEFLQLDVPLDVAYRIRRVARRYIEKQSGRRYYLRPGVGVTVFCDASQWLTRLCLAPP